MKKFFPQFLFVLSLVAFALFVREFFTTTINTHYLVIYFMLSCGLLALARVYAALVKLTDVLFKMVDDILASVEKKKQPFGDIKMVILPNDELNVMSDWVKLHSNDKSIDKLKSDLEAALQQEDYMTAAKLKKEIEERSKG